MFEMLMTNLLLFSDTMQILSVANNNLEEAMPVGRAVEELISLKSLGRYCVSCQLKSLCNI